MQVLNEKTSAALDARRSTRTRLGQINFINCLPVVYPLTNGHVEIDAELTLASPAELNRAFELKELDIGAMSSFHYLKNEDALSLLKGVSISSSGDVGSVLFFARKKPAGDTVNYRVAVPASSASSVALLKIFLAECFNLAPELVSVCDPDIEDETIDGVLVIGDRALNFDEVWSMDYQRVDLGSWWTSTFKLPMVFGLWAADRKWREENPLAFESIQTAIMNARDKGLHELFPAVEAEAARRTGLTGERVRRYYLEELDFRFGQEHEKGLALFRQLSLKHGLL